MTDGVDPRRRLEGIEGVRALAASSIVVYHVWLYAAADQRPVALGPLTKGFDNLRAGVTLFFILSGFLLFRPYVAAALRRRPTPSPRAYLRNRALRILPAYWVILTVVTLAFHRELLTEPGRLAANVFLLQNYFPDTIYGPGIVPAWSVAIEVVFYLCVPILGALAIRAVGGGGRRRVGMAFLPVALMIVTGAAAKAAVPTFHGAGVTIWDATFLTHADWFACGMALAIVRVLWEDGQVRVPRWWPPVALTTAAALFTVSAKLYYSGVLSGLEYQSPIALACALALSVVVLPSGRSRLVGMLSRRPLVLAGLASYSLFLWHDPLVRGFRDAGLTFDGRAGFVVNLLVLGSVSALAAATTYRFVEKPALARKRAWQAGAGIDAEPLGSLERRDLRLFPGSRRVAVAERIAAVLPPLSGDRFGEFSVDVPPGLALALDRRSFDVIVRSIIENALKYGEAPYSISAARVGGRVELVVEDRGRGVDPAFADELFEPFSRSHASRAVADGAGLGLANARRLARRAGGEVSYEPADPQGALFRVVLRPVRSRPRLPGWHLLSRKPRRPAGRPATAG